MIPEKLQAAPPKARVSFPKLNREFYTRPTLEVAPELLGKYPIYHHPLGIISAKIVEVEAYIGMDDPACHAAPGETARNAIMFGKAGMTYIYFIYGMYYCLNIVTEPKNCPAAVLIRAAEPIDGVEIMSRFSPGKSPMALLNGPGKLCRSFELTRKQNGLDLTGKQIYLQNRFEQVRRIKRSKRIGISVGVERRWRFFDADSPAVSGRK
jgi:DNA-3-methyladenine glycosylase